MPVTDESYPIYRFGNFEVDTRSGELRRNGARVKLQEQPLQVLIKLVEHAGEVVGREQLRSTLWAADTFVDFDTGLNTAIKRLRGPAHVYRNRSQARLPLHSPGRFFPGPAQ